MSPIIGAATGGFDFSITSARSRPTSPRIRWRRPRNKAPSWPGENFLTVVINFAIVAWVLFIVVKVMNQIIHSEPQAPPLSKQEMLLTEIRDMLKRPRPINGDQEE